MNDPQVRFKDLSGWLKFAFIYILIHASATVLYLLIYAIIGIASLN